jgi:hypothetical protein
MAGCVSEGNPPDRIAASPEDWLRPRPTPIELMPASLAPAGRNIYSHGITKPEAPSEPAPVFGRAVPWKKLSLAWRVSYHSSRLVSASYDRSRNGAYMPVSELGSKTSG